MESGLLIGCHSKLSIAQLDFVIEQISEFANADVLIITGTTGFLEIWFLIWHGNSLEKNLNLFSVDRFGSCNLYSKTKCKTGLSVN